MNNHTMYLVFWNDFLTIPCFADYYHLSISEAEKRINKGRIIHNDQFGTEFLPSEIAVKYHG